MSIQPNYPPIDREVAETVWPRMLAEQAEQGKLSEEEFLAQIAGMVDMWQPELEQGGAVRVQEMTIPSAGEEEQIPVLILRPAVGQGPFPCIYFTANGGKIQQTSRTGVTEEEAKWVADLSVAFISIAPRVGPKYPHPAQVEDAYAGLVWISENAKDLNIDPARIMVMGKSGGGGIAAATALYARDQGGPALSHQILIYPMLDDRGQNVSSAFDIAPWPKANNRMGWRAILGVAAGGPGVSPYAAAARATELAGLPPAYLEIGSSEVFRDETLDYAARLARAGIPMEVHSWAGGFHGFEIYAPDAGISKACLAARTSYLRRALRATLQMGLTDT